MFDNNNTYTTAEKKIILRWSRLVVEESFNLSDAQKLAEIRKILSIHEQENETLLIRYLKEYPEIQNCAWSIPRNKFNS